MKVFISISGYIYICDQYQSVCIIISHFMSSVLKKSPMEREDVLYVVDELERSLHSKLPERFLQLFMQLHDEHHMQLLFTTHYMKKGT